MGSLQINQVFQTVQSWLQMTGWLAIPLVLLLYWICFFYLLNYLRLKRQLVTIQSRWGEISCQLLPAEQVAYFENWGQLELVPWRHRMLLLISFVSAAPLCGLLGTVTGMVSTFQVLPEGAVQEVLASGIGEALLTTQFGLLIALPGSFGVAHLLRLRNRLKNKLSDLRGLVLREFSDYEEA